MIDFIKENPLWALIYGIGALFILFFVSDVIFSKAETFTGTVVDKQYKPEHTTNTSGYVTDSEGRSHFVTSTSHESEEFLIMVKDESGEVYTADSSSRIYYSKKVGDKIDCRLLKGYFTHGVWAVRAIETSYE